MTPVESLIQYEKQNNNKRKLACCKKQASALCDPSDPMRSHLIFKLVNCIELLQFSLA